MKSPPDPAHYSGILVLAGEGHLEACLSGLERLPGVTVHFVYPESSRAIVVLETATLAEQQEGLRAIQRAEHVIVAEMAYHRLDEQAQADEQPAARGRRLQTTQPRSSQ